MKKLALTSFLITAMIGCKKEDPKPEPPAPTPITSAVTTFDVKTNFDGGYVKLFLTQDSMPDSTLTSYGPSFPISATFTVSRKNIYVKTYQHSAKTTMTLTINSGHKSYTFVDTVHLGSLKNVALW